MSSDKNSPKNTGWIHQDNNAIFAGLVYLTPEIDPSCGTSMFKLKKNLVHDLGDLSFREEFHKSGIDKNYILSQILQLAYQMTPRPNIIIKAGTNAKWYLKICPTESIPARIQSQQWRNNVKRCTMWVIEWD
mgnify:CR=1 FL=1